MGSHHAWNTYNNQQLATISTIYCISKILFVVVIIIVRTCVGDTCQFAGLYHALQLVLVCFPVRLEDTRSTRHGYHECVGSRNICCRDRVFASLVAIVLAYLYVVVFYEGYGILTIRRIRHQAGVIQLSPVVVSDCIGHVVVEWEVKGTALLACIVDPVLDIAYTIPVFTYGVLNTCCCVVVAHMACVEAFHHVIAETFVAQVFFQEFQISLNYFLYVCALVVQVTAVSEVRAFIVVVAEVNTFCFGLG